MINKITNSLFYIYNFYFRNKLNQENDKLKSCLKQAQDDISKLLDEKRMLLETARSMQVCFFIN